MTLRGLGAAALACLGACLGATGASAAAPAGCPRIPLPPSARLPASPERIDRYLVAVDAASPLVHTVVAGRSVQGRPLRYAVVTALPAASLRAQLARLRAVRAGRARSAAGAPAVVWIGGGVHGNEPSGGDADLRLLRELAADCRNPRLRRLVVVVMPVQNPDGRAAGTRVNAAGFDLNRDWFARTQPETEARLGALLRLPPLVFVDQHEQGGSAFAIPPYGPPVHHETPAQAVRAIDEVFAPALRSVLPASTRERTFDLFYPGYGDSATTLLFGAAGMTLEAGHATPFARRVAQHRAAAAAIVDAADRRRAALLQGWGASFAEARAQGERGAAQRVLARPVLGYALAAGADALVQRLVSVGVRVERLTTAARVSALVPYGARRPQPSTLAAGGFVVPLAQPLKHWVQALLEPDSHLLGIPSSDDVGAWSNPLVMGLAGGAVRSALPRGTPVVPGAAPPAPERAALARRAPRVALLADAGTTPTAAPGTAQPSASVAWARWVLEQRFGVTPTVVGAADVAAGALAGRTHLVVPDGASAALPADALAAISGFVRAGGVYVGWRTRGLDVARAAGLTAARPLPIGDEGRAAGAAVAIDLDPASALAAGVGARVIVMDDDDPLVDGGSRVAARYPAAGAWFASPSGTLAGVRAGRIAALDEPFGSGRAFLLAFDPCFRGYADGSARLLANALLTGSP